MRNILVGDVGGTGSQWKYRDPSGADHVFTLEGYNPLAYPQDRLLSILKDLRHGIGANSIDLYYYGAGILPKGDYQLMIHVIKEHLDVKTYAIESDLLAASRALCGTMPGVVCILGTGSNGCYYDGESMHKGHSLGFPLGDEGSGNDIGRRLVRAFYYDLMPKALHDYFSRYLPNDRYVFLQKLTASSSRNQFLADITKLVTEFRNTLFVKDVVKSAFREFIRCHLHPFKRTYKINCVGSIAFYFCREFEECLKEDGRQIGLVLRSPLEALFEFHVKQKKL